MSIFSLHIDIFKQDFSSKNKDSLGEVHTDFKLINDMLNLIPVKYYKNPNLKWLDPCCGRGYFVMILYKKLFKHLTVIENLEMRHNHIIENMIYMMEINSEHIPNLTKLFGEKSNIINKSFFDCTDIFDVIIGNPPFNIQGNIKVPTNTKLSKKKDGKTIWQSFIKCSINQLKSKGFLVFITPSIWMKRDHPIFEYMIGFNYLSLHTLDRTQTNKIFHGYAQTPTCYFCLQNKKNTKQLINIYDFSLQKYIKYPIKNKSIPLNYVYIIKKLQPFVEKYGHIKVIKTSMRPGYKNLKVSNTKTTECQYENVSTCRLKDKKPYLVVNYSNIKCSYHGEKKIIMAHKMYGHPYYDEQGQYGISNRDNYVIINKSDEDFLILFDFLSTKLIMKLFDATRYRMGYLERYIFELIPDISQMKDIPTEIDDNSISKLFGISTMERKQLIQN
jgi:hypothetical protein